MKTTLVLILSVNKGLKGKFSLINYRFPDLAAICYDAKKQYDLMLESKQLELSRHLKELSQKNDQAPPFTVYFIFVNNERASLINSGGVSIGPLMISAGGLKLGSWRVSILRKKSEQQEVEEAEDKETLVDTQQETEPEPKKEKVPPLISTDQTEDLLGLNEINPKAIEVKENNALALAIVPLAIYRCQYCAELTPSSVR
ncbi:Synaptonemal complex protein 2 [Camellia lanceoleosa]|uniref:Synaptonemal complex protein 2 n=1 Tax=Camellia lanceoleosa TaxID=1840588 RepID=A0ACC0GLC4_9ERIC|nr:Synaptonemal complex protein 2 [Camellia lanceoleosa]